MKPIKEILARSILIVGLAVAPVVLADPNTTPVAPEATSARTGIVVPRLLSPLQPAYPVGGRGDHRVVLHLTLDRTGTVVDCAVVSGQEPFVGAARDAALRARFTPAEKDGHAVSAKIPVAVEFTSTASSVASEPSLGVQPSPTAPSPSIRPTEPAVEPPAEVVVLASEASPTVRRIDTAEARLMAGTFGDPLRAVELMPSITPLVSGVPYFFVRGAPPGSVAFYIGDAQVPVLYHTGPGSSILHPRLVEAVSLHPGPYEARFGDATSGVVRAELRRELESPVAEVEAKVFESSAFVGAPVGDGRGMVAIGGKLSHLGPVLQLVNPELRLSYWDYQAVGSYRLTPRDEASVLLLGAGDFVGKEAFGQIDTTLDTRVHRMRLGHRHTRPDGFELRTYLIGGLDRAQFGQQSETLQARSLAGGTRVTLTENERWEWSAGATGTALSYDGSEGAGLDGAGNVSATRIDTQAALFGETRWRIPDLAQLEGGLRMAAYHSLGAAAVTLEPRMSSVFFLSPRLTTSIALGYSTQSPSAAVPAPAVHPSGLHGGIQQALQRSWSLSYSWPGEASLEGTVFYNSYVDLSDPLSLTTVPDPLEVGETPTGGTPPGEELNFDLSPNGRAYGLELMVRRPLSRRLSGLASYTLSRSKRTVAGREITAAFDRTHVANAALGYDLGDGYRLGTRLVFYSGLPVRELGVTSGRTGGRSPVFTRVDLRASKEWRLSNVTLMLIAEMLNATMAKEILGRSCGPRRCITAEFGPVSVPSLGLRGTFGGDRATRRGNPTGFE